MSERLSTTPVGSSLPSPATHRHESGAVLRDVAVHHEPRVLGAQPGRRGGKGPGQPAREGEGRAEPAPDRLSAEVGAYQASAGEAAAYQRGHEAGRAEAESALRERQEESLRQGWQAGFEQGVQEGRERGLTAGREAGRQEVAEQARESSAAAGERLRRAEGLVASLEAELGRRLAGAEEEMLALCHAVVCRILGEQLVTRAGVAHCLAQALRQAGHGPRAEAGAGQALAVHLHPDDLALLAPGEVVPGAPSDLPVAAAALRWVADPAVRLGGCLVRSPQGTLDARLEIQLERLAQLLRAARPAPDGAGAATGRKAGQ